MEDVKPKIIFVVRNLSIGGINSVTSALAKEIEAQSKYEVQIISLSLEKQEFKGYEALDLDYFTLPVDSIIGKVTRLVNIFLPFFGSILLGRYYSIMFKKYIASLENVNKVFLCGFGAYSNFGNFCDERYICVSHSLKSGLLRQRSKVLFYINRLWLSRIISEKVVVVSEAIRRDWGSVLEKKIKNNQLITIENPIDTSKMKKKADEKISYDLPSEFFLFCGRLSKEKNLHSIISNWARSGVPQALIIAGDGPERKSLGKLVCSLGVKNRVYFLGFVDNPYPLIKRATAVLLNSHYEGLPTIAVEAQLLKAPLIIGECGAAAYDVVDSRYHGKIFSVADDKEMIKQIRAASDGKHSVFITDAAKYSADKAAKMYTAL